MFRIEANRRFERVAVIGEVVLLLRQVGQEDFVAVRECNLVVGVFSAALRAAATTWSAFSWSPGFRSRRVVIFMCGPILIWRPSMERIAWAVPSLFVPTMSRMSA